MALLMTFCSHPVVHTTSINAFLFIFVLWTSERFLKSQARLAQA